MNLGDRMKAYEDAWRIFLPPRQPVIIRVDGVAFHTLTRGCHKPFDEGIGHAMDEAAMCLVDKVQNARLAYIQSDEISVLLVDYNRFDSDQWFAGNLQKMASVSASLASLAFSGASTMGNGYFDGRAFAIPERDVLNYFIWRQQDCVRNSLSMAAQALYSHSELMNKDSIWMHEALHQKGINWNDYDPYWKRGRIATRNALLRVIPQFTSEPEYLKRFLEIEQE